MKTSIFEVLFYCYFCLRIVLVVEMGIAVFKMTGTNVSTIFCG